MSPDELRSSAVPATRARAGQALFGTMIDLSASPAERDQIAEYLAAHFPPHTSRAPKPVAGDVQIAFKEWQVPTLGQRSRDPVEAPDGSIWWAGQWANLIGRINPASGEMKEYPLPPNALPHTVTLDEAGNVWYTGNENGTSASLTPGRVRSPSTRCRILPRRIRIRRCSIAAAPLVHAPDQQHGGAAEPGDGRDQARPR